MKNYLDWYLQQKFDSTYGEGLKAVLESTIEEEKACLELFEIQINICKNKITEIEHRIFSGGAIYDLMDKKRAFEEQQFILNVAAQCQQCSYETKGIQKLLYFEKSESCRERIAVDASEMMYEWCEDLLQLTAKQFQDIAFNWLTPKDLVSTRTARKKLKDFYDKEKPTLANIRHNAGAHRDHDFMKQREVIESVNWSETIEKLHAFEVVTLDLGKSIAPLMKEGLNRLDKVFNG